ncbi:MAG: XRE family transcriptional regulator [candidate division Zixibacteria bacterium]
MDLAIGEKIKALRLASELTQAELADRARLTKGFISQLETKQVSISVDSLADILDALGVSLPDFFSSEAQQQVVFTVDDRIGIDSKGASRFEMLVPGSTNNLMDPIHLELKPGESLEKQGPLPGEQFGYVLSGRLTIVLGKKKYVASARECFYFKSGIRHQLKNSGKSAVKILWVTSPPLM